MILIKFLHSNLHSSFAIIVRSNHHGILQWSCIKEIEARLLIIHQLVQIFGLVIQLLGLLIFEEILITIDKDIAKVWMNLVYFLKSTVLETSNQWMLVHSIVIFDHSELDVLFWFTDEEFQEVLTFVNTFSFPCFFFLEKLEVVALFGVIVVLNEH